MSRASNFHQKKKAAKRERQNAKYEKRDAEARKRYREAQEASGLPRDVFALHRLLNGGR